MAALKNENEYEKQSMSSICLLFEVGALLKREEILTGANRPTTPETTCEAEYIFLNVSI